MKCYSMLKDSCKTSSAKVDDVDDGEVSSRMFCCEFDDGSVSVRNV